MGSVEGDLFNNLASVYFDLSVAGSKMEKSSQKLYEKKAVRKKPFHMLLSELTRAADPW